MLNLKSRLLVTAVRQLAADCPDCKYIRPAIGSCSYSKGQCTNGSVGCIIGQALAALGIDVSALDTNGVMNARTVLTRLGGFDDAAIEWADGVQGKQDNGATWVEAIKFADRFVYPL